MPLRPELFLFFPPSTGNSNENIRNWAAWAGYRSITVGHDNSDVLNHYCAHSFEERCYTDARHEIVYGEDTSPHLDVGPADSVVRRVAVLLEHLHAEHPGDGWDAYLDDEGHLVWEDVVLSGWSRGSGTAAFLARDQHVSGVVLFSGPMDRSGHDPPDVARWIQDEHATLGCSTFGIYHTLENHQLMDVSYDWLGLPRKTTDIDTTAAPYDGAHRLTTTLYTPTREWCGYHRAIGMDECMDPTMIRPYLHMMCRAAYAEPASCE
jgi:hypothetical protein